MDVSLLSLRIETVGSVQYIEISFDVDISGIPTVTAYDKGIEKTSDITISNEKAKLIKEDDKIKD